MSANTNNVKKGNATLQAMSRSQIRKAIKAAPNEIHADKISRIDLKTPAELKGSVVIAIIGPEGIQEQMTVHHPIGITDVPEGGWVLTRTNDVSTLIARKDDPNEHQIQVARNVRKNQYLINKGLLEKSDNGRLFYPKDTKKTRNEYLAEADLRLRADPDKKKGKGMRSDFLEETQQKAELAIVNALKHPDAKRYIESGDGFQTYRTRGGVYDNEDQTTIDALAGKNPNQVVDTLNRLIHNVVGKGAGVTVNVIDDGRPPEDDYHDDYIAVLEAFKTHLDEHEKFLKYLETKGFKDPEVKAKLDDQLADHEELLKEWNPEFEHIPPKEENPL